MRGSRAQSAPLAVILVLAVVITGSALVVAVGGQAITDTQNSLDVERASNTMTQLDSQAAMVAIGDSNTQRLSLPTSGQKGYVVDSDAGAVSIEYYNYETRSTVQIMDQQSMGSFYTESNGEVIAYQGGGVWRSDDGGSVMVSPPEYHYRGATMTFPLITLSGDRSISGEVVVTKNKTMQYYPNKSRNSEFTNPLKNGKVWVTVQSEFYQAWGDYFETRTDGEVEYDHPNEKVTVTLVVPPNYPSVNAGVVSGAVGSTMQIDNEASVDSYNSSNADYSTNSGNNSRILVAGDLEVYNNADIYGDVVVGGRMSFEKPNARMYDGNISYGTSLNPSDPYASGHWDADQSKYWKAQNASVTAPDSARALIDARRDTLSDSSNNDNDEETDTITSNSLDCNTDCTLTNGSYYVTDTTLLQDLTLDTTSGNIELVVDGDLTVDGSETMEVIDDGRVNVYVEGNVLFENDAEVVNTDDNSTQFWLYTNDDKSVMMSQNVVYKGVVFGAGAGGTQGTQINLENNVHVYGGLVGQIDVQDNNVEIHYDEALANTESVTHEIKLPSLTYLHISTNSVNMTSP